MLNHNLRRMWRVPSIRPFVRTCVRNSLYNCYNQRRLNFRLGICIDMKAKDNPFFFLPFSFRCVCPLASKAYTITVHLFVIQPSSNFQVYVTRTGINSQRSFNLCQIGQMSSELLALECRPLKGLYKRKEFAPFGSQFLPFRLNPFCKTETKQF